MKGISNKAIVILLTSQLLGSVLSSPALKELPSITYDTLPGYQNADQEPSESVGPITGAIGAYQAYQAYNYMRNLLRTAGGYEPQVQQSRMNLILTPFRMVRDAGSSAMSMAKTFATTFSTEFQNQYKTLSGDIKTRVIPETANLLGMWEVPQRESQEWLEGV